MDMDFGFLKNLFPDGSSPSFAPPGDQQAPQQPQTPQQMAPQQAAMPNMSGFQPTQAPAPQMQGQGLLSGMAQNLNPGSLQNLSKVANQQAAQTPMTPMPQQPLQNIQMPQLGARRLDPSQYLR